MVYIHTPKRRNKKQKQTFFFGDYKKIFDSFSLSLIVSESFFLFVMLELLFLSYKCVYT